MTHTIHIHEDDWGLRSIYPLAARDELQREIEQAQRAGERNRARDGAGWTDLYMIREPAANYLPERLTLSDIEPRFAPIMPRVTRFASTIGGVIGTDRHDPYGGYVDAPWCFGLDEDCYVYFNDEDGFVSSISYEFDGQPARAPLLRQAFAAIEALVPSVLADYRLDLSGPLGDAAFLDSYFAAHEAELKRGEKWLREYQSRTAEADWDD